MKREPPEGRELAFTYRLSTLIGQITQISIDYPWFHNPDIEISNAIEGIKNRKEDRVYTLMEAVTAMTDKYPRPIEWRDGHWPTLKEDLQDFINRADKTLVIVKEIEDLVEKMVSFCPECSGSGGKYGHKEKAGVVWANCDNCNGRGFFIKKEM